MATSSGLILWQFAPTKKFEPDDFEAFLKLLPDKQDGVKLRHVIEVRNHSFVVPEFAALLRKHNMPVVYADHAKYPAIADATGDFIYARLQTGKDETPTCYTPKALDEWAKRAKVWAEGKVPADLDQADPLDARRRSSRATCSSISSPRERSMRRMARWRSWSG